jgi:putative spermidine/putrescine transport system substrate-binding protein
MDLDGLTRRQVLKRGAVAGAGLVVAPGLIAACGEESGGAAAAKEVTLTFVSWGGTYQEAQRKAWLEPYMKANPHVKIVEDQPVDYAKIKAQAESGNVTWDVCDVFSDFGLDSDGPVLEPIDTAVVVNAGQDKASFGVQNSKYRVGHNVSSTVIAFRSDKFDGGKGPQNWSEFFDVEAFPGKRGLWKWVSGGIIEIALIADGVAPDALYPLDVDRAIKKLDTIKKDTVWWGTGSQSEQILADGEVTAAQIWNGRADAVINQGVSVEIAWAENMVSPVYMCVTKGSKNVEEAMKFIAYATSMEHNAQLSYHIPYGPATAAAIAKVDPSKKEILPSTYEEQSWVQDDQWWDANFADADKKFQAWVGS